MWICPDCKQKFVNKNQWHSCGKFTIEGFLEGKSETAKELFNFFIDEYRKIGKFDLHPVKTRVTLLVKMRFASINRLGKDFLEGHLVFNRPYNDALCFTRIVKVTDTAYVHHFKLYSKSDLTNELYYYMKLAYEIGERKHIKK